jgi:hypothetical protein
MREESPTMPPEVELPAERELPPAVLQAKREQVVRGLGTTPGRRTTRAAVAVLVVVLLAAAPAFAFRAHLVDLFSSAAESHPEGQWTLPPQVVVPPMMVQKIASRANVAASSLRQVVATGTGNQRLELVVGVGPDGRLWIGEGGESWATEFVPLERRVARSDAIVEYLRYGGSSAAVTDHAELVGFVRSDVRRIVVTRADGTQANSPLTDWRGFAYSAASPAALPTKIEAFDAHGRLVDEKQVDTAAAP